MRVLIGSSNPSKIELFAAMLSPHGAECLTPRDLGILSVPEESGRTPDENALLKARFYGHFHPAVFCNDSGLYFDGMPLDDPRQPGLAIRSPRGVRLDDEEMITYYSALVHSLGGKVRAYYLDSFAVYRNGEASVFCEPDSVRRLNAFWLTEQASEARHPGWPLDSLAIRMDDGRRYTEARPEQAREPNAERDAYQRRLTAFVVEGLHLIS